MNPDDVLIDPDFDEPVGGAWSRSPSKGNDGKERAERERRKVRRAKLAGRFAWAEVAQ